MRKTNRIIILIVLLSFVFIFPSCSMEDISASNENNNMNLFSASIYENNQMNWGYINQKGDFVIEPSFAGAEDFQSNGLAFVWDNNEIGIINRNGDYITQQKFSYISPFSEGVAVGYDESGFKAVDEKGQIIFEANSFISDFKNGMAYFSQKAADGKYLYGYIDRFGKILIEPQYENADSFVNDKAAVKLGDNNYAFIDKSGKIISLFNYSYIGFMGEGLIAYKEKDSDKTGYMDEDGNVIILPHFETAAAFNNGLAVVGISAENNETKYALINKKGDYIIDPDYNEIKDLGEGMFAVGIPINSEWIDMGCKYAVANSSGELLTDFVYYNVNNYNNGLASANDRNSTFFINKEGKRSGGIGSLDGIGDLNIFGNVIRANVDNRLSYMGEEGKLIWKASEEYKITREISIKEVKFRPNRNLLIYYPEVTGFSDRNAQDELNKKLKKKFVFEEYYSIRLEDDLDFNFQSDFSIGFYSKDLLSIEMTGYNYPFGAAHGMPVRSHSHIDLKTGKMYELKDLFRHDSSYIERINSIIKNKIEKRPEEYFPDSFKGVRDEQNFVITKDSLHIYFTPYEIASYAAGFPEFEIPYEDIMDIINTDGELWKAFN